MTESARDVALPRLTAALYLAMTLLMAGATGLCVHGAIQAWSQADRAFTLRAVAGPLVETAIAVAKDEAEIGALTELLETRLLQTAARPEVAAEVLARARKLGAEGNPRLVARQAKLTFDTGGLDRSFLQAQLFLIMRGERERGAQTVLNALANRYNADLDRRAIREAVAAWRAGGEAPAVETTLRSLPANESAVDILFGAAARLGVLSALFLASAYYVWRFAGDTRRLALTKRL